MSEIKIPNYRLDGKTAVITGSARGIGFATAAVMSAYGANVVISDIDAEAALQAAGQLENAVAIAGDITNAEDRARIITGAVDAFGKLDILVNNAGIGGKPTKMLDVSPEFLERYIDVDYKAVYQMSALAAEQMVRQGCEKGTHPYRIINLSSAAAFKCPVGDTVYGSLKAAVAHLTKIMANELARYGITVNAVAPGYVVTNMTAGVMQDEKNAEAVRRMITLRRYSMPEEIGGVINFLASPAAGYLTGVVLNTDGGMVLN